VTPAPARTPFDRATALTRLRDEEFDVLVVGGGITGAGVALDAAARGLRTALVERDDFAAGTSSKSSKMVHGGLRYLQQHEYRLVYENLAERQRLLDNAPHLVQPLPFLIPLFGRSGAVKKAVAKAYSTALWLYDLTGGIRIGRRHKRIAVDEVLAHLPVLKPEYVVAGFLYYDARADDARLTLAIARTAVLDHGAVAVNHAAVVGLLKDGTGRVRGARLDDGTEVRAACVVNAAGVWADDVRALDEGAHPQSIRPAKGVHIAVPWEKVRCDIAAVIPVVADRRSIFVVPWGDRVYLGTTDTDYDGPLDDPQCTAEDARYLLDAFNLFSREPLTEADILGAWAGLRPLVRGAASERTADLSRRHRVAASASGVVTVTGGKLTTYRKMAADTVDEVVRLVRRGARRSSTRRLALRGAMKDAEGHLETRFGTEARAVTAMVENDPALAAPLVPGLPYLQAEAVYAARYEMATTLTDVLSRRTRALLLARDAAAEAAPAVARLLAPELGWSAEETQRQVDAFLALVAREKAAVGAAGNSRAPAVPIPDSRYSGPST
jgi:glycerol-3-phosphate dehydrogenase